VKMEEVYVAKLMGRGGLVKLHLARNLQIWLPSKQSISKHFKINLARVVETRNLAFQRNLQENPNQIPSSS